MVVLQGEPQLLNQRDRLRRIAGHATAEPLAVASG